MKLSVYLIRNTVKTFDDIIQPNYLTGNAAFKELIPTAKLPYPCKAYVQVNKSSPPKWAGFLETAFKVKSLSNQTNSFVLLIKKADRFFAVTFGFGFQAIDPGVIEPRFGLLVAANWLTEVNGLEANTIDRLSSNKKFHLGKGSKITEFAVNPQIDFIRRLSGIPPKNNTASRLTGCDSCCIGVNCDIDSLGAICTDLLDRYESDEYKKRFEFLDYLQRLNKHDPRRLGLEAKLVQRLAAQSYDRISIAFPEMPNEELLHHYKVTSGVSVDMEELTLEGIYQFITDNKLASDPNNIHVIGIGDNDSPVTRRRTLCDYLAAEFDDNNETFLYCNGEWFQAEKNYVKKVRDRVAKLADMSKQLALVPIRNKEPEGKYNERLAVQKNLLLMDKKTFKIGGSYDKVEVCDLLTEQRELICVKKMESSSAMSHLFSQGSVSATLLRREEAYRTALNKAGKAKWANFVDVGDTNLNDVTVVYAIATRKDEPLAAGMFFFSLINLLNHVDAIAITGCKVAICKIDYEGKPAAPTRSMRKKKAKTGAKQGA